MLVSSVKNREEMIKIFLPAGIEKRLLQPLHHHDKSMIKSLGRPVVLRPWLSSTRNKSNSSNRWLERQTKDPHTKQAKSQHYRSRAAYKLIELDEKFRLFSKKSVNIVDLGFAPGAWTQVAIERMKKINVKSKILGVDLISCSPPQGSHFIQGDILSRKTHKEIRAFYGDEIETEQYPVDLVLSDMMANTSGIKDNDHFASMELCDGAMILSSQLLKKGGSLVMKFYTGKEEQLLLERMQSLFEKVYRTKPEACRDELREMYIVGIKKKTDDVNLSELFTWMDLPVAINYDFYIDLLSTYDLFKQAPYPMSCFYYRKQDDKREGIE